jgi:hypothetical protein
MSKQLMFLMILLLMAMPLAVAQDKDKPAEPAAQAGPPKPLDDEMLTWMVGSWKGMSESNMGTADETEKCDLSLDKQFIIMHLTSHFTKLDPDYLKPMAAGMKISEREAEKMVKHSKYKGMGVLTMDPKTGEYAGYWFDNWRGTYKGSGKLEGNKITMTWDGPMGSSTRTIERDENDHLVQSFKEKDMSGGIVEGKSVYTRTKK